MSIKMIMSEEKNINEALASVGIQVNNIYDLVNTRSPYPEAIPVLIGLLTDGILDSRLREGVVRALAVKEAKGKAGQILIEEFYKTPAEDNLLRWAIGNTIEMVICKDDVQSVLSIVRDKDHGMSRQMFVHALAKFKSEEVETVLIELLDDDDVVAHAIYSLGKLKSIMAKEKISSLLSHPRTLVRKEAERALKKIIKS